MNRTRLLLPAVLLLSFILAGSQPAGAGLINVSTGLNASNAVIATGGVTDAHWTATTDATYDPTGIAQTVFPNNADWYSGWLANDSNSDWIARNANVTNNGPAPYSFSTTFNLTGYTLSTVVFSGGFAIDDVGTLSLNGHQLGSVPSGDWGALTAFSVSGSSGDFVQGLNTITLTITSDDQYLEGVRLTGTVTGSVVPEPATIISTLIGGIMIVGYGRLRRKNRSR